MYVGQPTLFTLKFARAAGQCDNNPYPYQDHQEDRETFRPVSNMPRLVPQLQVYKVPFHVKLF